MNTQEILVFPKQKLYYENGFFLKFVAYDIQNNIDNIKNDLASFNKIQKDSNETDNEKTFKTNLINKSEEIKDFGKNISNINTTYNRKFICHLPLTTAIEEKLALKWKKVENITSGALDSEYARSQFETLQEVVSNIAGTLGSIFGGKIIKRSISSENLSTATKRYVYPNYGYMFEGVGFRDFTFSYKLIPSNPEEAETIIKIINNLKYYSLPAEDSGFANVETVLKYPAIWEINLLKRNEIEGSNQESVKEERAKTEIKNLIRFSDLVLTDLNITYGKSGEGEFYFFRNGMPNEINVSMKFTEMKFLTRETSGIEPIVNADGTKIDSSVGGINR